MENQPRSTHPMIIVAATTVTIASLAAIASFAGWIPGQNNSAAPTAQVAVAPTAPPAVTPMAPTTPPPLATPAAPVAKAAAPEKAAPVQRPAPRRAPRQDENTYAHESPPNYNYRGVTPVGNYPVNDSGVIVESGPQQQQPYASGTCRDCATVQSVREVKQEGEGTGLGAIGGGVVGGLLGNQVGGGRGKTVGAVVGAVGGAYAGNEIEKNVRSSKHYEITVRLDDGTIRVFSEAQPPALQRGDRVRIDNGQLIRL